MSEPKDVADSSNRLSVPASIPLDYNPLQVSDPGWWLIISDLHLPYHEPVVVEAAVNEGRRLKATGVIINGDLLDSHELSTYDKDPTAPRYIEELRVGKEFLRYLRSRLPKARIIFKSGNHEERLERYLMRKAPALFGLDLLGMSSILALNDYGVEHVGDKRVIRLGKLNVVHGHEYRPGIQAPVNPARGLFLRAKGTALCGHFHMVSEHHEPTITGKHQGCWSTGCLCQLSPPYMPLNRWGWGFALTEVNNDGGFSVRNLKVIDGSVT